MRQPFRLRILGLAATGLMAIMLPACLGNSRLHQAVFGSSITAQSAVGKANGSAESSVSLAGERPSKEIFGIAEVVIRQSTQTERRVAFVSPAARSIRFKIVDPPGLSEKIAQQTADLPQRAAATADIKLPRGKVRIQASLFDGLPGISTEIATGEATADIKVAKDSDGKDLVNHIKLHLSPVIGRLKVSFPQPWWSRAQAPVKLQVFDARGDELPGAYDATISLYVKTSGNSGNLAVAPFTLGGQPRDRLAKESQNAPVTDARDSLSFHSDEEELLVPLEDEGKESICASIPGPGRVAESCADLGAPKGYKLVASEGPVFPKEETYPQVSNGTNGLIGIGKWQRKRDLVGGENGTFAYAEEYSSNDTVTVGCDDKYPTPTTGTAVDNTFEKFAATLDGNSITGNAFRSDSDSDSCTSRRAYSCPTSVNYSGKLSWDVPTAIPLNSTASIKVELTGTAVGAWTSSFQGFDITTLFTPGGFREGDGVAVTHFPEPDCPAHWIDFSETYRRDVPVKVYSVPPTASLMVRASLTVGESDGALPGVVHATPGGTWEYDYALED